MWAAHEIPYRPGALLPTAAPQRLLYRHRCTAVLPDDGVMVRVRADPNHSRVLAGASAHDRAIRTAACSAL